MAASTTQRSLKLLRDEGWPLVQVVEKWIPQAKRHIDLFGFCDILAMHPIWGHLYVQTTSYGNVSARLKKIRQCEQAGIVLHEPNSRIQIHGWHKHGLKGQRKVWKARTVDVGLSEYYNVNENDWQLIYRVMEEVDFMIPRNDSEGVVKATATLENYPPRIEIFIPDILPSKEFDSEQILDQVSTLIERMIGEAVGKYDWLTIKNAWPAETDGNGTGYILRPRNYSDLAEMLRGQLA
jgi:hypothetical protein